MKEFMFFVRAEGNPLDNFSPEQQQQHVEKVSDYIESLIKKGQLKSAQPLEMEGVVISGNSHQLLDGPFNESKEVILGYYHILAKDMNEAVALAKADPRFEDGKWRLEIRPIMQVDGIN